MTQHAAGRVASPCISVCVLDAASGMCTGCLRTLDEIAGWIDMSDEARRRSSASCRAGERASRAQARRCAWRRNDGQR